MKLRLCPIILREHPTRYPTIGDERKLPFGDIFVRRTQIHACALSKNAKTPQHPKKKARPIYHLNRLRYQRYRHLLARNLIQVLISHLVIGIKVNMEKKERLSFTEIYKNYARYKSENNCVCWTIKIIMLDYSSSDCCKTFWYSSNQLERPIWSFSDSVSGL